MDTSNSGANHAVLHARYDRWGLEPIKTRKSGPKVFVCMQKLQMSAGSLGD